MLLGTQTALLMTGCEHTSGDMDGPRLDLDERPDSPTFHSSSDLVEAVQIVHPIAYLQGRIIREHV